MQNSIFEQEFEDDGMDLDDVIIGSDGKVKTLEEVEANLEQPGGKNNTSLESFSKDADSVDNSEWKSIEKIIKEEGAKDGKNTVNNRQAQSFNNPVYSELEKLTEETNGYLSIEGKKVHISELSSAKQKQFVDILSGNDAGDTEEYEDPIFDLTSDQEEILKVYATQGLEGLKELLEEQGFLDRAKATREIQSLENDEIFIIDARMKCPECTDDDLVDMLATAKESRTYDKLVNNLRKNLVQREEFALQQEKRQKELEIQKQIEQDRRDIYAEISSMRELIPGVSNSVDLQRELLPDLIEFSEDGQHSIFIDHLLSEPTEQYRAAFLYKYANDLIQEAYEAGKEEVRRSLLQGLPSKPVNKMGKNVFEKAKGTKNNSLDFEDGIDLDDY